MNRQARLEAHALRLLGRVVGLDEARRRLADLKAAAAAEGEPTDGRIGAVGALRMLMADMGVEIDRADALAAAWGLAPPT